MLLGSLRKEVIMTNKASRIRGRKIRKARRIFKKLCEMTERTLFDLDVMSDIINSELSDTGK